MLRSTWFDHHTFCVCALHASRVVCSWCGKTKGGAAGNCRCPKNGEPMTDLAAQWEGWGTALKPSFEPVCVAQKPYTNQQQIDMMKPGYDYSSNH
jgi:hypothetical protein